jgi:hypothetical protein
MAKSALLFLLLAGTAASGAAGAQDSSTAPPPSLGEALTKAKSGTAATCKNDDPAEVVVCGRSQQKYRIDPNVLAATRATEALPPKAPLDATGQRACVGPNCGGATIPLVGMALKVIQAVELAAQGDDWREAFRTQADAYRAYQDAKAKEEEKKGRISVGVSAGNSRTPK